MASGRTLKWFTALRSHQALASAGQTSFPLLAGLPVETAKGATITRMILDMWVLPDTINVVKVMDYGVVFINEDAVAAAAFPETDNEGERPDYIHRGRVFIAANALNLPNPAGIVHKDLRAQRICRSEEDDLRLICDLDSVAAGGVFITFMSRILIRLP